MANVRIEKAIVKEVSSPETVARIAKDRGLNPQEVFVRLTIEVEGDEYVVSNKLRFLGKEGYKTLLEAKEKGDTVDITVDTEKEFFYLNTGATLDDLFKTELPKREKKSLASLIQEANKDVDVKQLQIEIPTEQKSRKD